LSMEAKTFCVVSNESSTTGNKKLRFIGKEHSHVEA